MGGIMRLKNKKTGGLATLVENEDCLTLKTDAGFHHYFSLAELNEEWCDYEEPKEYWFIDEFGLVQKEIEYYYEENKEAVHDKRIAVGNYFSSREEAELAVRKLKAWKRLRDKGFRFTGLSNESIGYEIKELSGDFALDLDLLFNGGENG